MKKEIIEKYAKRGFLRDLLFNNIESAKDIWSLQKHLGIPYQPNTVMVVTIDNYYSLTSNKSEMQRQNLRLKILETLSKATVKLNALVVDTQENVFAILIDIERADMTIIEATITLGEHIKNYVQKETEVSVSVGIGRRYRNTSDLHLSYKDALLACKHKFFRGKSQVVHVDKVVPFSEKLNLFSAELESKLSLKILSCDRKGAWEILDELFENVLQHNPINPLIMKTRLTEITMALINIAFEGGADQDNLAILSGQSIQEILRSDTISDLRSRMRDFIDDVIREVSQGRRRMNLKVFEKAVKYIYNNFRNAISLEDVSNHVHLSPYYFSRGFKSFTGITFVEYITRLRIDEAKRLLLTTDLNIGEVGERAGYSDPNYFGRVFKNIMGIPPSKFRISNKTQLVRIGKARANNNEKIARRSRNA